MEAYTQNINLFFDDSTEIDTSWYWHWESYGVLLYYCYLIDSIKAEKLYKATTSTFIYEISNDLPTTFEDQGDEGDWAYLPLIELSEVVNFINNEVLVALQQDIDEGKGNDILVDNWGGGANFSDFLWEDVGAFFTQIEVESDESMNEDTNMLFAMMNDLRDFLQTAVDTNNQYYAVRY
jgi:hypothetical protein